MGWAGSARGSPAGSLPQGHSVLPPAAGPLPSPSCRDSGSWLAQPEGGRENGREVGGRGDGEQTRGRGMVRKGAARGLQSLC